MKKQLIGLLWALLICALITMLAGCTSTRYIPVKETVTDTVFRASDSLTRIRWVTHTVDSTVIHDSTVINRDASGNVTGTDRWHVRDRIVYRSDSLDRYKSLYASLLKNHSDVKPVPYPVIRYREVNVLSWWQKLLMWTGAVSLASLSAFLIYHFRGKIVSMLKFLIFFCKKLI